MNGEIAGYKSQLLRDGDALFADTAEDETVGKATEIAVIDDDIIPGIQSQIGALLPDITDIDRLTTLHQRMPRFDT
jgi:hypothetical protein